MAGSSVKFAQQLLEELNDEDSKRKREDRAVIFPIIRVAPEAVLGSFMTEGLMNVFRQNVDRKCRHLDKIPVDFQPTHDVHANEHAQAQIERMIEEAGHIYSADLTYRNIRNEKIAFPRSLDFRMELCEKFIVPSTDPRVQLRGQLGLRATTFIPEHTVLGTYRALLLPKTVTENVLVRNPKMGWESGVKAWEHEVRRYLVEVQLSVYNPETGLHEEITLDASPCGYDSPGALINDPHIFPEEPPLDEFMTGENLELSTDRREELIAPDNTTVCSAYICEFPFLFVLTTKPMIAGEEFLYNYGKEHLLLHDHFRAPRHCRDDSH